MEDDRNQMPPEMRDDAPDTQPIFLVPTAMVWLTAILVAIHVLRLNVPGDLYLKTLSWFSFFPIRFVLPTVEPMGDWLVWLTPFTHAFLHGDWGHLGVNCFWMVAFATPVLRRLGLARFMALFFGASAAGALAYFAVSALTEGITNALPMVGASGAVSGFMGAAARFALSGIAPGRVKDIHLEPRIGLLEAFTNRSSLTFIVGFFLVNALMGAGLVTPDGAGGIAWEAHLGGFIFGLLAFSSFDPMPKSRPSEVQDLSE